jgi:predicted transcriptional regulator
MNKMFQNTEKFNQNLTSWCVTNIVSEPTDFATNSVLDEALKPIWGACYAVEDLPEALDDYYTMEEGEDLKIRPIKKGINDSDPNNLDIQIFSIAGQRIDYDNLPQTINITIANNIVGVVNFNAANDIIFTPSSTGTITFPYIIKNTNNLAARANQIIEVIPLPEGANDPEAVNDSYTMEEGEELKLRPLTKGINDSDPNDLELRIFSIAGQEVDYDNLPQTINVLVANATVGVVNFNAADDILFTPSITGTITFPYVIKNTNDLSATANQIIEVIPVPEGENDPEALNDSYTMEEEEVLKIRPLKKGVNDSDPNDLDLRIFSIAGEEVDYDNLPQTINVTIANNIVGVVNFNTVNNILFTPSITGTITFPYVIKNTNDLSATANQIIEVIPLPEGANDPEAVNDYYTMEEGETLKLRPFKKRY